MVEESIGLGVEVSVTEGWSDEMPGTVVAQHIGGGLMREIHQEVGVFGPATFAPVGTVVLGGCNETESV